jgi:TM2 domain-containing membrane protein YozV
MVALDVLGVSVYWWKFDAIICFVFNDESSSFGGGAIWSIISEFLYIFSGFVFGYLEIYYKSIFPGLIVHIVNNTLSCVIVFLLEMVFDF